MADVGDGCSTAVLLLHRHVSLYHWLSDSFILFLIQAVWICLAGFVEVDVPYKVGSWLRLEGGVWRCAELPNIPIFQLFGPGMRASRNVPKVGWTECRYKPAPCTGDLLGSGGSLALVA